MHGSSSSPNALRLTAAAVVAGLAHGILLWLAGTYAPAESEALPPLAAVRMLAVSEPEPPVFPARAEQYVFLPPPEQELDTTDTEPADVADQFERRVERETRAEGFGSARPGSVRPAARGLPDAPGLVTVGSSLPAQRLAGEDRAGGEEPTNDGTTSLVPGVFDPRAEEQVGEGVPDASAPVGRGLDLGVFLPGAESAPPMVGGSLLPPSLSVDDGERDAINTSRSVYWGFFDRVVRALEAEWEPQRALDRELAGSSVGPRSDYLTVVSVTLDGDGALLWAHAVRSSGSRGLDDAALLAVRLAAPFRNVPEGLRDADGSATFRIGFHVLTDGSRRARFLP